MLWALLYALRPCKTLLCYLHQWLWCDPSLDAKKKKIYIYFKLEFQLFLLSSSYQLASENYFAREFLCYTTSNSVFRVYNNFWVVWNLLFFVSLNPNASPDLPLAFLVYCRLLMSNTWTFCLTVCALFLHMTWAHIRSLSCMALSWRLDLFYLGKKNFERSCLYL